MTARHRLDKLAAQRPCPACRGTGVGAGVERVNVEQTKITEALADQMVELAARIVLEGNVDPTTASLATAADLGDPCFRSAAAAYLAATTDATNEAS